MPIWPRPNIAYLDRPAYYEQHPDLLVDYQQSLDKLLAATEELRAAALKMIGMQELGSPQD